MRYAAYAQTLDEAALAEQYERVLAQHRESPSDAAAVKLALLLSRAGAHATALDEALSLLAHVRDEQGEAAELARLLHAFVTEQHVAEVRLAEERSRSARLGESLTHARAAMDATIRERTALLRQLNALKAVEERIALDPN